jgi:lysophospholipase L1-like esterase
VRKLSLLVCALAVAFATAACFGTEPPPPDPHRQYLIMGDSNAAGIETQMQAQGLSTGSSVFGVCALVGGTFLLTGGQHWPAACSDSGDWRAERQSAVNVTTPDCAVFTTGAGDLLNRVEEPWGEPLFNSLYVSALDDMIRIAGSRGARVVVVNAPNGLDPSQFPPLSEIADESHITHLNDLAAQEATKEGATLLDVYSLHLPIGSDGFHFTTAGYDTLVGRVKQACGA